LIAGCILALAVVVTAIRWKFRLERDSSGRWWILPRDF
jgi:hypothetical protein